MPDHNGPFYPERTKRLREKVRLRTGRPYAAAWASAMPETRAVERYHSIMRSRKLEHAAQVEILHHGSVSMQQHDRRTFTALDVMQPHAIDVNKPARGRVQALGGARPVAHDQRRCR